MLNVSLAISQKYKNLVFSTKLFIVSTTFLIENITMSFCEIINNRFTSVV